MLSSLVLRRADSSTKASMRCGGTQRERILSLRPQAEGHERALVASSREARAHPESSMAVRLRDFGMLITHLNLDHSGSSVKHSRNQCGAFVWLPCMYNALCAGQLLAFTLYS